MTEPQHRIPAFINPLAGSADDARKALAEADVFDVREVPPDKLAEAIGAVVKEGSKRVLISGGDGTIATAASALMGSETALAILPGGTLNHFATDLGIPTTPAEALGLVSSGTVRATDVGVVNGRLFLNTSSVGAYVHFVRSREYLEARFGYRIASAIAAFRLLFQLRLLDKAILFARQEAVRAHALQHKAYTLKRIATEAAAMGANRTAAHYALEAAGAGFTFGWAGYTMLLLLRLLWRRGT